MMTYENNTFESDLIKMHEEDGYKHALQWFLNDIFELKDKYCLDKQTVREAIDKVSDMNWLDIVKEHMNQGINSKKFNVATVKRVLIKCIKKELGLECDE